MDIVHFSLHFHWPGGAGRSTENGDLLSDSNGYVLQSSSSRHDTNVCRFTNYHRRSCIIMYNNVPTKSATTNAKDIYMINRLSGISNKYFR